SAELNLLEEATISVCKSLGVESRPTGIPASDAFTDALSILVCSCFFSSHLFIWQVHNALLIICCLLKVFISQMSEEELQLHFTYEDKA
ncbi:DYM protein, partial [Promerops cafer]|nr:DYM protein [Promerops cafer]